jgi:Ca-activated chloride channel family protein
VSFAHPWWLAGGLAACVLLLCAWRLVDARQRAALGQFVSAQLRVELTRSISLTKRRMQRALYLAAVALLFTALAGPLVGFRWVEISRRGNEIVFAVDTSRSMLTPDVKPNRLARAKLAIDDFIDRLDGDAVGIVAFAGSAFLVCPITLDYAAFHESLGAIDTNTIPRGGTNTASAIREAQVALRRRPGSDKILILVTDGEDLEGGALAAAEAAKQEDGLKIFAVGVGTAGGELIPIPPEQGGGFVKDETGAYVKSRLDESALKALAAATGGFYVPLGTQGEGLETIAKSVLGTLAKHDLASRQQKVYIERYQWPLAASLAALLSSLLMGTRRGARARARAVRRAATGGVTAASCLIPLMAPMLMVAPMHPAHSAAAPSAEAVYNSGTQAYRAGQFPQAAQAFQQAINQAPSGATKRLADQQDAYYNLGNALYRTGQKTEQSAPQETLQKWTDAVKAYETALQLRADDADSKYNRDLVKRKIEALKQQQNQNQNQKGNQNPQQNQGQNPAQNPGQGKGPGQPPPQGQPPSQGQPPQGQPPQGQPPQGQPPQGQPPQGQPPQGQPPGQGQPPPPGQPPDKGQPGTNPPRNVQSGGNPDNQEGDEDRAADNQRPPGQMSREEARELLDSVKSDERRPPGTPLARRGAVDPPDEPLKNW